MKVGENTWELTGRATLEELGDIGLAIDTDEVDTIGGYLSMEADHVPAEGEEFVIDGWLLTVLEADAKLVHRLRMEPARKAPVDAHEGE